MEATRGKRRVRLELLVLLPLAAAVAFPDAAAAAGAAAGRALSPWQASAPFPAAPWAQSKLQNQAVAASAFFFNLLTPAALIAAGALNDAFIFVDAQKANEDSGMRAKFNIARLNEVKWQRLTNAYCFLMIIAFGTQLMTVFMGTIAGCRMLGGHFDPMAENVVAMLVREFEWDYVAVRTQFVTGILAFILAQALRVYKELHQRELLARAASMFLLFCAGQCLAFFNSHLTVYGSFVSMLVRYGVLAWSNLAQGGWLAVAVAVLLLSSAGFSVLAFIEPDGDGEFDVASTRAWWRRAVLERTTREMREGDSSAAAAADDDDDDDEAFLARVKARTLKDDQ